MRLVALCFLYLIASGANAQGCKNVSEIIWSDELLYYYFKTPGIKVIPFPSSLCDFKSQIIFKNIKGKTVGKFEINTRERHRYDDLRANSKRTPEIVKRYHNSLIKEIKPTVLADIIFKALGFNFLDDFNNKIQFVSGRFTGNRRKLTWNPYSMPKKHWNAVNITYKQLIQFYAKPNVKFMYLEDDESYLFPKVQKVDHNLSNILKFEIPDYMFLNFMTKSRSDEEVVLFSSHKNAIRAYNYLTLLSFKNKRKVFWFSDADSKWIKFKFKNQADRFKDIEIISGKAVIDLINSEKKFEIVDIGRKDYFKQLNFKKTRPTSILDPEPASYKRYIIETRGKKSFYSLPLRRQQFGDYILVDLYKIEKSVPIILVGNHMLDADKTLRIHKLIRREGHTKIYILMERVDQVKQQLIDNDMDPTKYFNESKPTHLTVPNFR